MSYKFLDNIATADVAFEAWGACVEDMFISSAEATMNVMVENLNSIAESQRIEISLTADSLDLLLFNFLQEFIFYKDAEQLLLRTSQIQIKTSPPRLNAVLAGEILDPQKHELIVDVKAVTLHRFAIEQNTSGWEAFVILDV